MGEIHDLTKQISFNNSSYNFSSPDLSPMDFFGFKGPLHCYKNTFNGDTSIKKVSARSKRI